MGGIVTLNPCFVGTNVAGLLLVKQERAAFGPKCNGFRWTPRVGVTVTNYRLLERPLAKVL